ncbi:hypothetical protein MTO96_051703 [Rhipicephalus appendiculatus]
MKWRTSYLSVLPGTLRRLPLQFRVVRQQLRRELLELWTYLFARSDKPDNGGFALRESPSGHHGPAGPGERRRATRAGRWCRAAVSILSQPAGRPLRLCSWPRLDATPASPRRPATDNPVVPVL